jgi:hypothetical protein
MKNYLFAALLGCFVVSGLAQTRDFIFTDTQGRCWQCPVGIMCFPCRAVNPNVIDTLPDETDPTCEPPTCQDPLTRMVLSSHNIAHKFYQCVQQGTVWGAVEMTCPCDLMFNYKSQACDWPYQWQPFCTAPIVDVPACADETTTTPAPETTTQLELTTTVAATTPNPCQCIPWIPCWCNPCMMGGMMGMGCMG